MIEVRISHRDMDQVCFFELDNLWQWNCVLIKDNYLKVKLWP